MTSVMQGRASSWKAWCYRRQRKEKQEYCVAHQLWNCCGTRRDGLACCTVARLLVWKITLKVRLHHADISSYFYPGIDSEFTNCSSQLAGLYKPKKKTKKRSSQTAIPTEHLGPTQSIKAGKDQSNSQTRTHRVNVQAWLGSTCTLERCNRTNKLLFIQ